MYINQPGILTNLGPGYHQEQGYYWMLLDTIGYYWRFWSFLSFLFDLSPERPGYIVYLLAHIASTDETRSSQRGTRCCTGDTYSGCYILCLIRM